MACGALLLWATCFSLIHLIERSEQEIEENQKRDRCLCSYRISHIVLRDRIWEAVTVWPYTVIEDVDHSRSCLQLVNDSRKNKRKCEKNQSFSSKNWLLKLVLSGFLMPDFYLCRNKFAFDADFINTSTKANTNYGR